MSLVYLLAADGFEEVEGLTVVDLLRRAGIDTKIVSISDSLDVVGARNIHVVADLLLDDMPVDGDILCLPGGMPGTNYLKQSEKVRKAIHAYHDAGKLLAAICAAPTVYGEMNLLQGKKATCYPDMEDGLLGADLSELQNSVVVDLPFITSRGVGTAIDFALSMIEILISKEKADQIAASVVYRR